MHWRTVRRRLGRASTSSTSHRPRVGAAATAVARLVAVDGRLLTFIVTASDPSGDVAQGTHTRVIVDRERFSSRSEREVDDAVGFPQRFEELVAEHSTNYPTTSTTSSRTWSWSLRTNRPKINERLFEDADELFGLYEGVPQTERDANYTFVMPDKISIFRGPAGTSVCVRGRARRGGARHRRARGRAPLRYRRGPSHRTRLGLERKLIRCEPSSAYSAMNNVSSTIIVRIVRHDESAALDTERDTRGLDAGQQLGTAASSDPDRQRVACAVHRVARITCRYRKSRACCVPSIACPSPK